MLWKSHQSSKCTETNSQCFQSLVAHSTYDQLHFLWAWPWLETNKLNLQSSVRFNCKWFWMSTYDACSLKSIQMHWKVFLFYWRPFFHHVFRNLQKNILLYFLDTQMWIEYLHINSQIHFIFCEPDGANYTYNYVDRLTDPLFS